jgi:hypothetical protein
MKPTNGTMTEGQRKEAFKEVKSCICTTPLENLDRVPISFSVWQGPYKVMARL